MSTPRSRPTAVVAAAALVLAWAASAGWDLPWPDPPAVSDVPPCETVLGFRDARGNDRLVSGAGPLALVLAVCPAERGLRAGDRVRIERARGGCAARVSRLPGETRLGLGCALDVNADGADDLAALPGVGAALAERLAAGRPYRSAADLEGVRGLGPARARRLAERLQLRSPPPLWPRGPPPDAGSP